MTLFRWATVVGFIAIAIIMTHCSDSATNDIELIMSTSSSSLEEVDQERVLMQLYDEVNILMESINVYDSLIAAESDPARKAVLEEVLVTRIDSFEVQRDIFTTALDSLMMDSERAKAEYIARGDTLSKAYTAEGEFLERIRAIKGASQNAFAGVVPVDESSDSVPVSSSGVGLSSSIDSLLSSAPGGGSSGDTSPIDSLMSSASKSDSTIIDSTNADSASAVSSSGSVEHISSQALSSVTAVNSAPVIDTLFNTTLSSLEDSVVSFVIRAHDADGDSLQWSMSIDSIWGSISIDSQHDSCTVTYTPFAHKNGLVPLSIRVSDGELNDTLDVSIDVASVNDAPEYIGPATLSNAQRNTETIVVHTGSDCVDTLDGSSLVTQLSTYWYRDDKGNGYGGDSLFVGDSLLLTSNEVSRFIYAEVRCTDGEGAVTIQKTPYSQEIKHRPNSAPVITEAPQYTVTYNEDTGPHSLTIHATDPENDTLVWAIVTQPAKGSIAFSDKKNNSVVVDLSGVPQHFNGSLSAVVEVRDPFDTDTLMISFTIQPVNDAPVITGSAELKGDFVVTQTVALDTATFECRDIYDLHNTTTVDITWYRATTCGVFDLSNELVAVASYMLVAHDEGACLFVVASCTDNEGAVVYDTSSQSVPVAAAPEFNQERLLRLQRQNSEYVQLPVLDLNPLNRGVLTVEAWVQWSGLQGNNERVVEFSNQTTSGDSKDNIILYHKDGESQLRVSINNGSWEGMASPIGFIVPGAWTHVAVVISDAAIDNVVLFKNSVVMATGTLNVPIQVERTRNLIGGSAFVNDDTFDGLLENVRVWNSARTQQEITDNMFHGFDELTHKNSLVASYDFRRTTSIPTLIENRMDGATGRIVNGVGNDGDEWLEEFSIYRLSINANAGGATMPATDVTLVETQQCLIEAVADQGYQFEVWQTSAHAIINNPSQAKTTISLTGDATVTAEFSDQYIVTVVSDNNCALNVEGEVELNIGEQLELRAYATTNSYLFSKWVVTGSGVVTFSDPTSPHTQITVAGGDVTIEPRYLRRHDLVLTIHPYTFQDGCVVNKPGGSYNGANVETERCPGSSKERWRTQNDGVYYALRSEAVEPRDSYIIMDAEGGSNANIRIWGHTKGQERHSGQFTFDPSSDGTYRIRLREDHDKCLDLQGSNQFFRNVYLLPCNNHDNQKWIVNIHSK